MHESRRLTRTVVVSVTRFEFVADALDALNPFGMTTPSALRVVAHCRVVRRSRRKDRAAEPEGLGAVVCESPNGENLLEKWKVKL